MMKRVYGRRLQVALQDGKEAILQSFHGWRWYHAFLIIREAFSTLQLSDLGQWWVLGGQSWFPPLSVQYRPSLSAIQYGEVDMRAIGMDEWN